MLIAAGLLHLEPVRGRTVTHRFGEGWRSGNTAFSLRPPSRQVHKTNGQYTRARKKMEELEAAAVVEGGSRRRRLLARGMLDLAESDVVVASPAARDGGGRALQAWGKKSPPPPPPPVPGAGSVMYMVVGFEVVACSIFRKPGAARLDDIPCPVSPEDPDAPSPMEVKEGALRSPCLAAAALASRPCSGRRCACQRCVTDSWCPPVRYRWLANLPCRRNGEVMRPVRPRV